MSDETDDGASFFFWVGGILAVCAVAGLVQWAVEILRPPHDVARAEGSRPTTQLTHEDKQDESEWRQLLMTAAAVMPF